MTHDGAGRTDSPGRAWQRAGTAALVALAALLPFELTAPVLSVGPLAITTVELGLYVALLIWTAGRIGAGRAGVRWTAAHTAVAIWAAVLLVAALAAPQHRAEALKFALRSLGGCALFVAAADLLRTPRRVALTALALTAGALLSAGAALAELTWAGAADGLAIFKIQPTLVGRFLRAGGTFQHANIAAMYWEAVLPVGLAGCAWWAARRPSRRRAALALGALLLPIAGAIVLSGSRAALIVTVAALALLAAAGVRAVPPLRAPALAGLVAFVGLSAIALAANPWMALRLRGESNDGWYRVAYAGPAALEVRAGETMAVPVTVRNDGLIVWRAGGANPVRLSYHWHDRKRGRLVVLDGERTALPNDVPPGRQVTIEARVIAPPRPGLYTLRWDMVEEGFLWFSAFGAPTGDVAVRVHPAPDGAAAGAPLEAPPPMRSGLAPSRAELWRAAWRLWRARPLLGVGPDNFRRLYAAELGLGPPADIRLHANNLYVETAATTGLAGTLAFVAVLIALAGAARRAWAAAPDPPARALVAGVSIGLGAFVLHGLADYFFPFTATYALFWILAGAVVGLAASPERGR